MTREYPLNQIETVICFFAFLGMIAFWVLHELLKIQFSRPVELTIVWGEVGLVLFWRVLCGIEGIGNCVERSVKRRVSGKIEQYITENVSCSYDELISAAMNIRVHRGFDEALAEFEHDRKFSVHDGICRLPTSEDKRRWRDMDVDLYGVSFEELEQVFAHPLEWYGGKLRIEFSVWGDEEQRLEKELNEQTNTELYICTVADGGRWEFASFAELADALLFDGQTLKEVCGRICVSYANDFSWPGEFFEINCSHL